MKGGKVLPVHLSVGLETECYHQIRLSAVLANHSLYPWFLSRFTTLTLWTDSELKFPMIRFEDHLEIYDEILNEQNIIHSSDIILSIRKTILEGAYVLIYLDYSQIPDSKYYMRESTIHEMLIYGFDDKNEQFDALAFEIHGKSFGTIRLSYEMCDTQYKHTLKKRQEMKWFAYYGFPLAKIKIKSISTSINYRTIFFSLDKGRNGMNNPSYGSFAKGYAIHESLALFYENLMKKNIVLGSKEYMLWNMSYYKLLAHNLIFQKRLDYMRNDFSKSELNRVFRMFTEVKDKLIAARAMSIKYRRYLKEEYLKGLIDTHRDIYTLELKAISMLMEMLIRYKLF